MQQYNVGLTCPFSSALTMQYSFKSSLTAYYYQPFQGALIILSKSGHISSSSPPAF